VPDKLHPAPAHAPHSVPAHLPLALPPPFPRGALSRDNRSPPARCARRLAVDADRGEEVSLGIWVHELGRRHEDGHEQHDGECASCQSRTRAITDLLSSILTGSSCTGGVVFLSRKRILCIETRRRGRRLGRERRGGGCAECLLRRQWRR
jgi:hypothetical protein